MNYWLLKTEPEDYSFLDLQQSGMDVWDGVRNRQAQKHLRAMSAGDKAFIYHTGKERAIVGVAEIVSAPLADPTNEDFHAVNLRADYELPRPVTLKEIKEAPQFSEWALVRQSRLSVMPVSEEIWHAVLNMARR